MRLADASAPPDALAKQRSRRRLAGRCHAPPASMPNVPHSVKPRNPGALRDAQRVDPRVTARTAGLRYSTDSRPGLSRQRHGRGFSYRDAEGAVIRDRATLARIRALAIPPAWTDVWICPDATGHVQATGRDARGRKQHRYHPLWTVHRDEAKYERLIAFAAVLPRIRARCDEDLARPGLGPGEGHRGRGPAAGAHAHPGRQRRVRPAQPLLRVDHVQGPPRARDGHLDPVPVSRQVRAPARGRASGPEAGDDRQALARTCPARSSSSTSTTRASRTTSPPTT